MTTTQADTWAHLAAHPAHDFAQQHVLARVSNPLLNDVLYVFADQSLGYISRRGRRKAVLAASVASLAQAGQLFLQQMRNGGLFSRIVCWRQIRDLREYLKCLNQITPC